jgi:hypothetical protein
LASVTLNFTKAVPRSAVRVFAYGLPTVAEGSAVVLIASTRGATTSFTLFETVAAEGICESRPVTVNEVVPEWVGVPEITPAERRWTGAPRASAAASAPTGAARR